MQHITLGELEVSRIGLGAMGMSHGYTDSGTDVAESVADQVQAIAAEVGATPAQVALAWLLSQGEDIAPVPGTERVARVEENTAAAGLRLSADVLDRLSGLPPGRRGNPRGGRPADARTLRPTAAPTHRRTNTSITSNAGLTPTTALSARSHPSPCRTSP